MELDKRKQKILAAVVEQYIATGEPIGSKALCKMLDISVSSATIRNEMSELVNLGYLMQPYTSAGRIPSQKGYRYYVDNLMNRHKLNDVERQRLESMLGYSFSDPEKLLEAAAAALADVTNCASISTTLADEAALVKKVEFVPVSRHVAIIVLLTSKGILKSKMCRTDTEINEELKMTFNNIIDKNFIGKPVSEITTVMIQTIVASLGEKAFTMTPLLISVSELSQEASESDILLEGQTNLLTRDEYEGNVNELLNFLGRREQLANLISSQKKSLHVLIGQENHYRAMANSSMILGQFDIQGHKGGTLGIIGPVRIDYAKLIPNIEYLSALVGRLLSEVLGDE